VRYATTQNAHPGTRVRAELSGADIVLHVTMSRVAPRLLAAGAATLTLIAIAAPAGAEVPEGWSDPAPVSFLQALLVLVGIPFALFVGITLLVSLPSMVSGASTALTTPDNEWFGGPRKGIAELAEPDDEDSKAGGASVRW